jgi:hypothetical protein
MMQLTLLVCSILHGAQCRETHLTYADEGQFATPYGCAIGGMHRVAEWSEAHPNWSVTRWRCEPAGRYART